MSLKPASANTLLWFSGRKKNIQQMFKTSNPLWNRLWHFLLPFYSKNSINKEKLSQPLCWKIQGEHSCQVFQAAGKVKRHFREFRGLWFHITIVLSYLLYSCLLTPGGRWDVDGSSCVVDAVIPTPQELCPDPQCTCPTQSLDPSHLR